MPNYKSTLGVDQLYYALITQDDADGYAADTPAYLAPLMTITIKPKTNSKVQYADNQPFDSMTAEGESEADVEITNLPLDVRAILLGRVFDAATGRTFDNGGTPPHVAIGYRALKSDGLYRYYWYLKCQFSAPDDEAASKTDTPDPKSSKLKMTAIRTIHQFALDGSITDSVKFVSGDDAFDNFSATTWFDAVQSPSVGSPASFTLSSSPADAATGVAVGANVVLTFSNPLAGGAENGIVLTSDAGVVKACARSISSDRKVVTLNPSTDLASSTTYLVIVPHVVSVYGQTLADTVIDFTTA